MHLRATVREDKNMKIEYTSPELEIIRFGTEDVIVTSLINGNTVNEPDQNPDCQIEM